MPNQQNTAILPIHKRPQHGPDNAIGSGKVADLAYTKHILARIVSLKTEFITS
jgi:hypothetical protein